MPLIASYKCLRDYGGSINAFHFFTISSVLAPEAIFQDQKRPQIGFGLGFPYDPAAELMTLPGAPIRMGRGYYFLYPSLQRLPNLSKIYHMSKI